MTDWIALRRAYQAGAVAPPPQATQPPAPPPPPPAPPQAIRPPPPAPPAPPPPAAAGAQDWVHVMRERQAVTGIPMGTLEEEVARILSLPVIDRHAPRCPDHRSYEQTLVLPNRPDDFALRSVQIDAIWTYETYGGLLAAAGVGAGKTLIAMGSAIRSIQARGHYRTVIMVPPEVFGQFVDQDLPWARSRLNFCGVVVHPVRGTAAQRLAIASTPGPGIWIYTYTSLQTKTGYEELQAIDATCYILDEAHCVASTTSTRTKRWHAIMQEQKKRGAVAKARRLRGPGKMQDIEVVAMSGTILKKHIADYAHLATCALGSMSPVPTRGTAIHAFGQILDAEATGAGLATNDREAATMLQFLDWAHEQRIELKAQSQDGAERVILTRREQIQLAYQERLNRSAGVIVTQDQGVDASLLIRWVEPKWPQDEAMDQMVTLMKRVIEDEKTPNGDTIDYGMHQYKWLWELSSGFYNQYIWPTIDEVVHGYHTTHGRIITTDEAEMLLEAAYHHHGKQQDYHKEMRQFLDYNHIPGADSPLLVDNELAWQYGGGKAHHRLPPSLIIAYAEQLECGPKVYPDLPQRYSIPVRVTSYKIDAAVEWALRHQKTGGLMWYHHPEIGHWVSEALTAAGVPHTFAGAGMNQAAYAEGLVVASYSHSTGKNLQHQDHNLFIELRREAHVMEQALGRTHRSKQKADVVKADMLLGNGFDLALFNGILNDADSAQANLGTQQRLCYATYDPVIPPINPRLMLKLGIIKNVVRTTASASWEQITPASLEEAAELFRPIAWGTKTPR